MELELALKIVALIALSAFIVLSVFAITSLARVSNYLREFNQTMHELSQDLVKNIKDIRNDLDDLKIRFTHSMDHFDSTSKQITITAKSIDESTSAVFHTLKAYTGMFDKIYNRVSSPLNDVSIYVSAFAKAVTTFTGLMTKSK